MASSVPIGIACPVPSERALFAKWLEAAHYQPVLIPDVESLPRVLESRPIEALVATADVVSRAGLATVSRILTANRPLVVVGRLDRCPPEFRQRATCIDRPTSMDALTMGVALALAEGRPVRRSFRKHVLHVPATVDGLSSQVVDVSAEGVRLQLLNATRSSLPPFFTLRVEVFGVATVVQRVWMAQRGERTVLCGGTIQRHLPKSQTWEHLVTMVPAASPVRML